MKTLPSEEMVRVIFTRWDQRPVLSELPSLAALERVETELSRKVKRDSSSDKSLDGFAYKRFSQSCKDGERIPVCGFQFPNTHGSIRSASGPSTLILHCPATR